MRRLLVSLCLLLPACANQAPAPFVDTGVMATTIRVEKVIDNIEDEGEVRICHGQQTPLADVDKLALLSCGRYGLEPRLERVERYQCRVTAPHRAVYACVDPNMRFDDGSYVNPFNGSQVRNWEYRTGKTAPKRGVLRDLSNMPAF